ncbi:MAG TPA: hypothetical protein VH280_17785 [Verrucomicrobiae bacterium]|jgi:hypothetical protein|nr:hypothetical protein [Verrucomicrobiae bacterium]
MENEPKKSNELEQRVAKLESMAVNSAQVLVGICTNFAALTSAVLSCKNDCIALIGQQGELLRLFATLVPEDGGDVKAEILNIIRRGESAIDQKEALFSDLQNQLELLKQKLPKPILPQTPPTD